MESVAAFIGAGLGSGEGALVVATAAHRECLAKQLAARGFDLAAVERRGQYVALDAAETLSKFMVQGLPDELRFQTLMGGLVTATRKGRGGLRAFGEMVALLWEDGNKAAAIRLEELWNGLAEAHSFCLFCAYPINGFADARHIEEFDRICRAHSVVLPSENYYARSEEERMREIAALKQRALALEAEIARRKQAEDKLRRREAQLTEFVENASLGLHWVGPDGIIQWANKAEFQMLGYTADEYIGRHIAEFHADRPVIDEMLARLMRGERLQDYEARLKCKDGSIKTVLIDSSVLWEEGRFIHTQCFMRDITARKAAEEALRQSEATLHTELADSKLLQVISAEIVFEREMEELYEKLVDAARAIMRSDFASMQMFYPERGKGELRLLAQRGFEPEAAKTWEWVSRETPSSCGEALRQSARVVVTDVQQCDLLGCEGLRAYRAAGIGSMQSTPLFSRTGQLVGMISTHWRVPHQPTERELGLFDILARQAADVIERRRAEMRLRESEERYRQLISLMPAAVYTCDAEGRITFYNQHAARLWGREPKGDGSERFCGCHKVFLADATYVPPHQTPMATAIREGKTFRNVEATVERPDGSRFVAAVNIDPLWDADGKVRGAINVFQDITERKRAEANLRKRGERLELLSDTLAQLLSARDPDTIVRELFPKVAAHLGVDTYFNFMVNPAGDALSLHSCAGISQETARGILRLEFGQAICGTVAQTRQPIHATHIQSSDYDKAQLVRSFGLQCYACNPLMVGERLLGTLSFASRTRVAFDEDELQFLRIISQYTAVALDRLRTTRKLRESQRQLGADADALSRLNALGSRLWQAPSLQKGIEEILEATMEMLGADLGNIQLLQRDTLRMVAQRGFQQGSLALLREVSTGADSLYGRALRNGGCVIIEDVEGDQPDAALRAIGRSSGFRAVQATPVIGREGKALGMLSTYWRSEHKPEQRQLRHLNLYVRQAADFIERWRMEQALRESEARFRAVLDNSTAGIYVKDCDGKYLLVNECYRRRFHLAEIDILGKTDFDIFPTDTAQKFRDHDLKVSQTGQSLEVEETGPPRDDARTFMSIKFPLRRTDGSVYAVAGISTDITDRQRAQESKAMLAAIVEHSDDAIFSTDLEGVITSWNRGAERLYGYTAQEAIGKPMAAVIQDARENEHREILERIRAGQTLENYETIRHRKDGPPFHVSLTVSPVKDSNGRVVGVSKVARDITEKARAREILEQTVAERTASLREAMEQMEEFSYSVSHDLRAPLRAMSAYAGVLLEEYSGRLDGTACDYLEKIRRSADRMNRLTQDVLTYSRIARAQLQLGPVATERLVQDIIHQYSYLQPPAADIQIAGPLLEVMGNETSLGQCVANLLNNAVKFIAPGVKPRVRIWTERKGKNVRLWFEDNGIGIKPHHQERIFQMFERVHPEGKYEGTGIGLTIVRKAAEKMGGKVGFESDGLSGSRFWIELRSAKELT